ncbi:MAG: Lrp/AsnC family transcriptional regulator [Chitinivibrionales bacterium]|nr:Lrp/AsnC family transcriptional regulator [Chitinivibrionales bacterium]
MTGSDKKILALLQKGFPICENPYQKLAEEAGITENELLEKIEGWKQEGLIRKIGAFVNHRISGYTANGMAVFDMPKDKVREIASRMAGRDSVSHCYERPRLPRWPYRLYAMIHGKSRDEVETEVRDIVRQEDITDYRILFSTRELKKTGSRLFREDRS